MWGYVWLIRYIKTQDADPTEGEDADPTEGEDTDPTKAKYTNQTTRHLPMQMQEGAYEG